MNASANMIDAIERLMSTHQIPREDVVRTVGDIAELTEDRAKTLLMSLADGEFGGITRGALPPEQIHPVQFAVIYGIASQVWGQGFMPPLREFLRGVYPEVPEVRTLSRRQAARVIIELDRKRERRHSHAETAAVAV